MTKYWVHELRTTEFIERDESLEGTAVYKAADLHAFLDKVLAELGDTRYTERCRLANVTAMCKEVREG